MDCREVTDRDVAEAYVAGRLDEAQIAAFEAHYFECDACFERLEACRALRRALAAQRRGGRGASVRRTRMWAWSAVAAAAAVVVAVLWARPETAPPAAVSAGPAAPAPVRRSAVTETLARFEPPRYAAMTWREGSTGGQERFRSAMARYTAGDYRGAIPDLRRAVVASPAAPETHFFLGICLLLTGDVEDGNASLARALEFGDTPYLESAHFYLAKGLLMKGDSGAARAHLTAVLSLRGDLESQARGLLRELDSVAQMRPPKRD